MLSLRELPVAIPPGDGDGGIWTGSLIALDTEARPDLLHLGERAGLRPGPRADRDRRRHRLDVVDQASVRGRHPGRHGALPRPVGVPRRRRLEHGAERSPSRRARGAHLVSLRRSRRLDVSGCGASPRGRRRHPAHAQHPVGVPVAVRDSTGGTCSCCRATTKTAGTSAMPSAVGRRPIRRPALGSPDVRRPALRADGRARRARPSDADVLAAGDPGDRMDGCAQHPVSARRSRETSWSSSRIRISSATARRGRGRMSRTGRRHRVGRAPRRAAVDRRRRRRARRAADDGRPAADRDCRRSRRVCRSAAMCGSSSTVRSSRSTTQRGVYGVQVPASPGLTIVGDADAVLAYPLERAE